MSLQKYVQQLKSTQQNNLYEGFSIPISSVGDVDSWNKENKSKVDVKLIKALLKHIKDKKYKILNPKGNDAPIAGSDKGKIKVRIDKPDDVQSIMKFIKDTEGFVVKKNKNNDDIVTGIDFGSGSLPNLEGGKSSGKGPTGAEWENVITSRYNELIGKPNADEDANKISEKFPNYHDIGNEIAKNLKKKGLEGAMTQFGGGKSKANLSDFWIDNGGKDGTPKTDMYSKDFNISLKKKGGSQLASGMTGETIATFNAALGYMGTDRKSQPKINEIMEMVEKNFTKLKTSYTVTAIRELEKKKDSLTQADKKILKQYSETEAFHKELNEKVIENLKFGDNKEFREFYIYECLSGFTKFNNSKAIARASVCVEFDAKTGAVSKFYQITKDGKKQNLSNTDIKISPDVKTIASKAKLYAAWKTPDTGPHSSFRVGLTNSYQEIQELPTLRTLIRNEIMNDKIANAVLKEDIYQLDEFAIIRRTVNKLKKIGRSAKMWTTNLISKIAKKVEKTLNAIKKMGSRVFEGLFKFLGIELKSVKQSLPKDVEEFAFGQDA